VAAVGLEPTTYAQGQLGCPVESKPRPSLSERLMFGKECWWRRLDSNQRPTPRDSSAVPSNQSRDRRSQSDQCLERNVGGGGWTQTNDLRLVTARLSRRIKAETVALRATNVWQGRIGGGGGSSHLQLRERLLSAVLPGIYARLPGGPISVRSDSRCVLVIVASTPEHADFYRDYLLTPRRDGTRSRPRPFCPLR
jgi:hypothetical protein